MRTRRCADGRHVDSSQPPARRGSPSTPSRAPGRRRWRRGVRRPTRTVRAASRRSRGGRRRVDARESPTVRSSEDARRHTAVPSDRCPDGKRGRTPSRPQPRGRSSRATPPCGRSGSGQCPRGESHSGSPASPVGRPWAAAPTSRGHLVGIAPSRRDPRRAAHPPSARGQRNPTGETRPQGNISDFRRRAT